MDTSQLSMEVRGGESKEKRFWGVAEKRQIVEETLEAGASVAWVQGVNANQAFGQWPCR